MTDHLGTWTKCNCGSSHCKREYPSKMGTFYQGCGFEPEEKELIIRAFSSLAASPVQAGIDPLVAEIEAGLKRHAAVNDEWGRVVDGQTDNMRQAAALLRSQAERIAALESDAVKYNRMLEVRQDRYVAAESLLAEAREALDIDKAVYAAALIWCGEKERETFIDDIEYFKHNWRSLPGLTSYVVREFERRARATLSRLKPGEKGGEA